MVVVEAAPGGEFREGQTVVTVMGGMGRKFDGGYADYTCVPAHQVQTVTTGLSREDWARCRRCCRRRGKFHAYPMQHLVDKVMAGTLRVSAGPVFHIDDVVEAHRCMEANKAGGKVVVLT